jgi:hypothetical protein
MTLFVKHPFPILCLLGLIVASPASAQSPAMPSLSQSPPPISIGQVTLNTGATFAGSNEPIGAGLADL